MTISKRQKIGVILILLSFVAGVVVQLVTGDLVSITRTGTGVAFVVGVRDLAFVLGALALIGLGCFIIPPRDKTNA
jgi:hypothetical protein